MNKDYVSKLHVDLRTKLDRLCLMHNEPVLHVAEHFAELRSQIDYDAEKLIEAVQSEKRKNGKARKGFDVNKTRLEFIRILDELEKRTRQQSKPQTLASEVYVSLKQRVDAFKDSSSSLDDLEESYVQLAQEILDETDLVEERIFGEQAIIYWPQKNATQLGSLVYIGDVFLSRRDISHILSRTFSCQPDTSHFQSPVSQLLVPAREPYKINKSSQVLGILFSYTIDEFGTASKFYYFGKTNIEYLGYSIEGSAVDKEFFSYITTQTGQLLIHGDAYVDTSSNLFDVYLSKSCTLSIAKRRLESIHPNLLPSPFDRLTELSLSNVHLESFDTTLLSQFTNLTQLSMQVTFSKDVKLDLEFLRPMRKLELLELTLPGSSWDFSAFSELIKLEWLKLESSSFFYAEKLPRLSKAALAQILSPPELKSLKLSCFDIETIDRDVFNGCCRLNALELTRDRIGNSDVDACKFIGFPLCFVKSNEKAKLPHLEKVSFKLIHSGIRVLKATSFIGMKYLTELSLTGNLIADLPCGVFHDLPSLRGLELSQNRIRHICSSDFGRLDKLETLSLGHNPIESIEANAFAQLNNLIELSLNRCRLKSIDSEMFNGLKSLDELRLSNNLIERIEVIAEDGRQINVAKANLSDEEKELIKKHLFADLSRLSTLDLDGNKLEKLDLNCFSNLKGATYLYLKSNSINELSGVVGPELLYELKSFNLNNNLLTEIDKNAIPKNLYNLNLAKNHLKRLDEDFFTQFTQLTEVNLSENELTWTINEATFSSCSDVLCSIDLSLNESIQVTEDALRDLAVLECFECDFSVNFFSLPALEKLRIPRLTPDVGGVIKDPKASRLKMLDFSKDFIETLDDPDFFANSKPIYKINLSGNRLSRIHRDIFKCLPELETIDLSGNKLSSIDMGLFRQITSLRYLNLSSNNISFINLARLLRVCPDLESLNIADNQLDERSIAEPIDSGSCMCLEKLVLANNRFEKMDFVRDMTSLKYLDLRENQIQTVMSNNGGENLLGRLRKLIHLDLSNNIISPLTDEIFAHLHGKLEHLDISGNPLDSFQLDSVLSELI